MEILNKILNKIKEYDTIIIHGHKRPDGDCYAAQFGLKDIITASFPNKKVHVVGEVSEFVKFLGDVETIEDSVYENALSIVVDTAIQDRISDSRYTLGKEIIKIDHHEPIEQYGDLIWVDTSFPSCAQMIGFFYRTFEDELKMTKVGARAMYTGILTDTGRFRYRGVSQVTHEIAGLLVANGADVVEIDTKLSTETMEQFKFKGHLLNNAIFEEGFLYSVVTKELVEEFKLSYEDAAATVNLLGGIEGYGVWFLALEYPDEIRLRIRSNSMTLISANKYNGGGHKMASGARLESFDDLPLFVNDMKEHIKNYK